MRAWTMEKRQFWSRALAIALVVGLGFTTEFAKSDLGGVAFAGLLTTIYLGGIQFFPRTDERLHMLALLGRIGIGVTAVVLCGRNETLRRSLTEAGERPRACQVRQARNAPPPGYGREVREQTRGRTAEQEAHQPPATLGARPAGGPQ